SAAARLAAARSRDMPAPYTAPPEPDRRAGRGTGPPPSIQSMPLDTTPERTAYRICPLCEATCGLEVAVAGDRVLRVRGDRDDVFSAGFLCPKGPALKQLHEDPDRLRAPVVRRGEGFETVSWDDAFVEADRALRGVIDRYGPAAVAVYLG